MNTKNCENWNYGQFGPRLWSIQTLDISKLVRSRPFVCGQLGPLPMVNSDRDNWQFGPLK